MKNPFRSEAEAYRFVLGTVAYFVAIVIADVIGGRWWGLAVFVVLSLFASGGSSAARPASSRRRPRPVAQRGRRAQDPGRRERDGHRPEAAARRCESAVGDARANVLVVTPALNSPLRHWTSDEDGARAAADDRLQRSVAELDRLGISARGEVGDADPVQAIEDALRTFGADEIIISTHPEGRSQLARARRRHFGPRALRGAADARRRRLAGSVDRPLSGRRHGRQVPAVKDTDDVEGFLARVAEFWASEEKVLVELYGVAAVDPAARDLVELQRRDRYAVVPRLVGGMRLRRGLREEDASHLAVLSSFETYLELRRHTGLAKRTSSRRSCGARAGCSLRPSDRDHGCGRCCRRRGRYFRGCRRRGCRRLPPPWSLFPWLSSSWLPPPLLLPLPWSS